MHRWRREGPFAVVPSLFGPPTFSYLPGLVYTDLAPAEAETLAREVRGRAFNIRVLGALGREAAPGSRVVMRLDLASSARDPSVVWKARLRGNARWAVRRGRRAGCTVGEESGPEALASLAAMVRLALARNGAPTPPESLFAALVHEMGGRILVVRTRRGEVAAALLWLRDGPLALVPWRGSRRSPDLPDHLLSWAMIEEAARAGAEVLDWGSCAREGGVYRFKRSFGGASSPVSRLADRPANLYRKYAPAQRVFRALPGAVSRRLGPKLCRYLADY